MTKYRIYANPDDRNQGYTETFDVNELQEGFIEGYHYDIIIIDDTPDPNEIYLNKVAIETNKYVQRVQDGQYHHAVILAKLRASLVLERIDNATHNARLSYYSEIQNLILSGQHNRALDVLNSLGYEPIGEEFYNEIFDIVNGYVDMSFNSNLSKDAGDGIGGGGIKNPPTP